MGGTTKDVGAGPAEVTSLLSLPRAGADPYGRYRRLRELDPVHFNPHVGMWFLTRHASCVAVLRDRRFSAELGQGVRRRERRLPPSMLTSDPPEHGRLRRPAGEAFGERAADAFRPRVERLVDELLDALQAGEEVDLVASFTEVLSVRLLAELLGVPEQDRERFREDALAAAPNLDPLAPPDEQERGTAAAESLADLFRGLLARRGSGAGVLGALATATRARGDVSSEELVATCTLLVVGGQEPLAALVANGVLALLRHPDELRRLREDTSVDRTAVDELLRFDSPIQFAARVARADVDVGGRTIPRGDAVVALLGAANRDPDVFADPDRLDLARRPNPHLTFGAGPHLCLGAPLTRVAGRAALTALARRFPRLALAVDEVAWRGSLVPHAPASLRVRLR